MMRSLLFICSAKGSYTRNDVLRSVLPKIVGDYREIVSERKTYFARLFEVVTRWMTLRKKESHLFLGFLAQLLVPFAALLGQKNIVMDFFISLYDTLCLDRCVFRPEGWVGRFLRNYDRWCIGKARLLLTDTEENADFYADTFGIERSRFLSVPVSANPEIFKPVESKKSEKVRVFFYCTFLPLHGAEVVYGAARLLGTEEHIEITIIGKGPTSADLDRHLKNWQLENVRRLPWVPYHELGKVLAESDICLAGHFSRNPKAQRVIPGKAYQFLAMAKPIIVGDNPANRRVFTDHQNAIFCDPISSDDLARSIWHLANDPALRDRVGRNGFLLFQDQFHPDVIAERLRKYFV